MEKETDTELEAGIICGGYRSGNVGASLSGTGVFML